jgi:hypothetical protein
LACCEVIARNYRPNPNFFGFVKEKTREFHRGNASFLEIRTGRFCLRASAVLHSIPSDRFAMTQSGGRNVTEAIVRFSTLPPLRFYPRRIPIVELAAIFTWVAAGFTFMLGSMIRFGVAVGTTNIWVVGLNSTLG